MLSQAGSFLGCHQWLGRWAESSGGCVPRLQQAQLAVIRANATGERRGTVFVNPGEYESSTTTFETIILLVLSHRWARRLRGGICPRRQGPLATSHWGCIRRGQLGSAWSRPHCVIILSVSVAQTIFLMHKR